MTEKVKVIVIAGKSQKEYLWIVSQWFGSYNLIDLQVINLYMQTAEELLKVLNNFGIEEYYPPGKYGIREKIETTNIRTGSSITVNVIKIRKLGAIWK